MPNFKVKKQFSHACNSFTLDIRQVCPGLPLKCLISLFFSKKIYATIYTHTITTRIMKKNNAEYKNEEENKERAAVSLALWMPHPAALSSFTQRYTITIAIY